MVKYICKALFLFAILVNSLPAQHNICSPQQLKSDIDYLRNALERKHPGLYTYTPKTTIDSVFSSMYRQAENGASSPEAQYRLFTGILPWIKDGHTLFFPSGKQLAYANDSLPFFPFDAFVTGDHLYVQFNFASTDLMPNGSEILQLNGLPAAGVLQQLRNGLMRDGHNLQYPDWILNNYFGEYYSYFFGHPDTFDVQYRTPAGEVGVCRAQAQKKAEIRRIRQERYPLAFTARGLNTRPGDGIVLRIDREHSLAVLTIRDFDQDVLKANYGQVFKPVLQRCFEDIQREKVQYLAIDLRGNQGGDLKNGIFLLSNIMRKRFRVIDHYAKVRRPRAEADAARCRHTLGKGMRKYRPQRKAFRGEVFLLTDGGSFSNSGIVSAVFRHYQRGKILGETTGGNSVALCGDINGITLPHTGISVYVPQRRYVIYGQGKNTGHGVAPDVVAPATVESSTSGRDVVMEHLLELIR